MTSRSAFLVPPRPGRAAPIALASALAFGVVACKRPAAADDNVPSAGVGEEPGVGIAPTGRCTPATGDDGWHKPAQRFRDSLCDSLVRPWSEACSPRDS